MAEGTVFFSWQSDTQRAIGRNLIDRAIEQAIALLRADLSLEEAVRDNLQPDSDTKGVAGSPPIVDTIFRKIESAAVFVPDLTFAGTRLDGRPTPNANVCIEYGWALKCLGHGCIVPVMNTAYGEPIADNMPFDLRHLRNPLTFHCPADAPSEEKTRVRKELAVKLAHAIAAVLKSDPVIEERAQIPFTPRATATSAGRFCEVDEPIGFDTHRGLRTSATPIVLERGPTSWLRVMPFHKLEQELSHTAIEDTVKQRRLQTIWRPTGGYGNFRREDGYGSYFTYGDGVTTPTATCVFDTGEVWGVDTFLSGSEGKQAITYMEPNFCSNYSSYIEVLQHLGISGPFRWIAGIEGLKGKGVYLPAQVGVRTTGFPQGHFATDAVVESGVAGGDIGAAAALKPFFVKLYDRAGIKRPDWMDNFAV